MVLYIFLQQTKSLKFIEKNMPATLMLSFLLLCFFSQTRVAGIPVATCLPETPSSIRERVRAAALPFLRTRFAGSACTYMYTNAHMYTYIHIDIYTHTWRLCVAALFLPRIGFAGSTYVHIYTHMRTCIHIYRKFYTHIRSAFVPLPSRSFERVRRKKKKFCRFHVYIYIHICAHVYIHANRYIHTYIWGGYD